MARIELQDVSKVDAGGVRRVAEAAKMLALEPLLKRKPAALADRL
jgi:ABC-type sugar transport system ATPase subunit